MSENRLFLFYRYFAEQFRQSEMHSFPIISSAKADAFTSAQRSALAWSIINNVCAK